MLTNIPVLVARETEPMTFERILSGLEVRLGTLTTEHSASSYGLPVLVMDGEVFGPADLPAGTYLEVGSDFNPDPGPVGYNAWKAQEAKIDTFLRSAVSAGYRVPRAHQ